MGSCAINGAGCRTCTYTEMVFVCLATTTPASLGFVGVYKASLLLQPRLLFHQSRKMVRGEGLEPSTCRLKAGCSNQLSYPRRMVSSAAHDNNWALPQAVRLSKE